MSRGVKKGSAVIELNSYKYSPLGLRRDPALSQRYLVVSAFRPSPSDKHRTVPALIPHAVPSAAALGMLVGGALTWDIEDFSRVRHFIVAIFIKLVK